MFSFRVCESKLNFFVVKTINEKKQKVAILPKCIVSSFDIALPLDQADFSFEAIVLQINEGFPVIAFKPELIDLKDELAFNEQTSGASSIGIVDKVSEKYGVTVRYSKGESKLISVKDLESTEKISETYPIGRVVRTAFNTASRLSLKRVVVNAVDGTSDKRDSLAIIKSFGKLS